MMKHNGEYIERGLLYAVSEGVYVCEAQITVMAAMVFMIVISFVTTCVNAAAMSGYNTIIKQACSLSDESVFSAYSNDLLKHYDIFALKKSDIMNEKVYQYIKTNINTYSKDIELINSEYNSYGYMTDDGGAGVEKQIVSYMKSGGYADIIRDYNSVSESIKQSSGAAKTADNIVAARDTAYQGWKEMNKLLILCRDIGDKENSIADSIADYIAECKKENEDIINEMATDEEKDDKEKNDKEKPDEVSEAGEEAFYKLNKQLADIYGGIREMSEEATGIIEALEEYNSQSEQRIRECYEELEALREDLGETLYQELHNDLEAMLEGQNATELPSVNDVREAIYTDNSLLDSLLDEGQLINTIKTRAEAGGSDVVSFKVRMLADKYSRYINEDNNNDNSTGALKQLYSLLKEGIAGLVIQGDISDKVIDYDGLAVDTVSGNAVDSDISNMAVRSALVNEYILSRCTSYIDYIDGKVEDSQVRIPETGIQKQLDYEIEYILCGEKSDRDNLKAVLTKLSIAREAVNLSYLITDSVKKQECFTLALNMLGYTGNMLLIKAVQYLIMSIWAYAESIVELRQIYKGGSIDIVKNAGNWKTDIDGIMSISNKKSGNSSIQDTFSKWEDNTADKENKLDGLNRVDYKECMRLLLLIQNRTNKNARIMSVMELMMISLGHSGFRMKDYIYKAEGEAAFTYVRNKQIYRQKLIYSYA